MAIEAVLERFLRWRTGGLVTSNGPFPWSGSSWKVRPNSFIRRNHLPRGRPQSLSRPTLLLRVPLTSGTPSISIFILFLFITKGVFFTSWITKVCSVFMWKCCNVLLRFWLIRVISVTINKKKDCEFSLVPLMLPDYSVKRNLIVP